MADQDKIIVDEQGRPRYFSFERREPTDIAALGGEGDAAGLTGATPQQSARNFLVANADALGLAPESFGNFDVNAAVAPSPEGQALRFENEQAMMDSSTVTYVQTMFGLPIYQPRFGDHARSRQRGHRCILDAALRRRGGYARNRPGGAYRVGSRRQQRRL